MRQFLIAFTLFIAVGALGGAIMMLWIVLEWWVWGFNPISNLYFAFGLLEIILAVRCLRSR